MRHHRHRNRHPEQPRGLGPLDFRMAASGDHPLSCPRCGAARAPEHRFCGVCGAALAPAPPTPSAARAADDDPARRALADANARAGAPPPYSEPGGPRPGNAAGAPYAAPRAGAELYYYISPNRIVLMTFLTAGLYLFYWMYLTWRQYRDHTGEVAYPVWHALALAAPIYQFFRLHAHIRVYQELMQAWDVPNTLRPMRAVGIFLSAWLLNLAGLQLGLSGSLTPTQQVLYFGVNLAPVGLMAWLMAEAQGNLNRYWQRRLGERLGRAGVSSVEVILALVGVVQWGLMLMILLVDPSALPAPGAVEQP